jgi:hypothetical protein
MNGVVMEYWLMPFGNQTFLAGKPHPFMGDVVIKQLHFQLILK